MAVAAVCFWQRSRLVASCVCRILSAPSARQFSGRAQHLCWHHFCCLRVWLIIAVPPSPLAVNFTWQRSEFNWRACLYTIVNGGGRPYNTPSCQTCACLWCLLIAPTRWVDSRAYGTIVAARDYQTDLYARTVKLCKQRRFVVVYVLCRRHHQLIHN